MPEVSKRSIGYVAFRNHDGLHVTCDRRPSRFSVCNIEKLGLVCEAIPLCCKNSQLYPFTLSFTLLRFA